MAKRSIGKLFGRRPPPPAEVGEVLAQLARLAEQEPALREAANVQSALISAMFDGPAGAVEIALSAERAAEKLAAGTPLLRGEELRIDATTLRETMLRLANAAQAQGVEPAPRIATALRQQRLDPPALARAALNGQIDELAGAAETLGLDGGLVGTLLRFSLFRPLSALAGRLAPLRAATVWQQGHCPTCGSWPLLAEQRGLEQLRYLRCGLCASEWAFDRLRCPFCDNRDHDQLEYLFVEGQEQKRAMACGACHGYLKVYATLTPAPPLTLALLDLSTLPLDMVAHERGYGSFA